jgi:exonuclease III
MDMRFGTWNVRSLHRTGLLKTIVKELGKCKLELLGVQEVRWEEGGTEQAEDYTFLYGEGNGDHQSGTGFFVPKRIILAVRRVEYISDRMTYIILRCCLCSMIVLHMQATCEGKSDDVKATFYEELGHVFDQFSGYDVKILLSDFNVKVGRENIFRLAIQKESLHEINNDTGVRVVNFATSKNLVLKCTMFLHSKIHKYTWTCPEGNTHNQTDHILVDRRQHSSILDVQSFRGAYCHTDHYLVVAKVREGLALSKRAARNIDTERFSLRKIKKGDVKEQYQVTIRNKFASLENLRGQWGHQQGMG